MALELLRQPDFRQYVFRKRRTRVVQCSDFCLERQYYSDREVSVLRETEEACQSELSLPATGETNSTHGNSRLCHRTQLAFRLPHKTDSACGQAPPPMTAQEQHCCQPCFGGAHQRRRWAPTPIFSKHSASPPKGGFTFNGAMMTPYETTGTWFASSLGNLHQSLELRGRHSRHDLAGRSSARSEFIPPAACPRAVSGFRWSSGQFFWNFDGPATSGHYVGISKITAGDCADIGASYPTDGQQVVGRARSILYCRYRTRSLVPIRTARRSGWRWIRYYQHRGWVHGRADHLFRHHQRCRWRHHSGQIGAERRHLRKHCLTTRSLRAKITGTAATLGSNTFLADQTIQTN